MTLEQLLRAHVASDDREEADRVAMLRLAAELAEPTSRDQERAHFTASAFVVDAADNLGPGLDLRPRVF